MRLLLDIQHVMDVGRAVWLHCSLASHDHWTREQLATHQRHSLTALVRHAFARSPFYRKLYGSLRLDRSIALDQLPVVGKRELMANFDRLVTDNRLKLAALHSHMDTTAGDSLYLDEYRVLRTAGTTGEPGVFVYSRREWSTVLADTLRWQRVIGVSPRLPHRIRIASIGAATATHISYRLTASGDIGLFKLLNLNAASPIADLTAALNAFQPDVLLPYPSVGALLASEQIAGRLRIHPHIVSTHSEVMTKSMASKMFDAWGGVPFDHYGLTEHPNFGCACSFRRGIHLFEDLFIAEIVDDHDRPVPDGHPGHKLLLTNLYNFTQPLIRYEVSDMLTIDPNPCACGRPFRLVSRILGRNDDILFLPGVLGGSVPIHPLHFWDTFEQFPMIAQYRVEQRDRTLSVQLVAPSADREVLGAALVKRLQSILASRGAVAPPIDIQFVDVIERRADMVGKTKLVVAAPVSH